MKHSRKLNNAEIAVFCDELSLLLPSGITVIDSMMLLERDAEAQAAREIYHSIVALIKDGLTFSEALAQTGLFSEYVIAMVALGEESGNTDIIIKKLADYYSQQRSIAQSIKSAVTYPLVMICMMLIILIVLLSRILPIFNQVFMQLGSGLTGVAGRLMLIGEALQSFSYILIFIVGALAAAFLIFRLNRRFHDRVMSLLQNGRHTGRFFLNIAYSKFAGAMSLVTAGGIDVFTGLEMAKRLAGNSIMDEKSEKCKECMKQGQYLYEGIREADIFKAQHQRLLQIANRTGDSDAVFRNISDYYEEAAIAGIRSILGAIEPTLVIVFSLIVGLVLMSVIMPLIGIMSGIG